MARRVTFRPSTLSVTASDNVAPANATFHQQHPWLKVNEPVAPEYDRQIGLVLFDYGSNKPKQDLGGDPALTTGWWNCAKFRVQCDFVLQCFNKLHGDTHQLMLQIDQSSGHMSRGDDALNASSLNLSDGGFSNGELKKGIRDTTVYEEDFGPFLSRLNKYAGMIDPDNPIQYCHYPAVGDNTNRYDSAGPRLSKQERFTGTLTITIPKDWKSGQPLKVDYEKTNFGTFTPPPDAKEGDKFEYNPHAKGKEWWRGIRKGQAQLLFETGWMDPLSSDPSAPWVKNWGKHKPSQQELKEKQTKNGKKIATLYLQSRRDFREEKTIIEKLFIASGHIVVASPRYHPEVAGNGVEYCWGKAKWCFRRHINNLQAKDLDKNVLVAVGSVPYKSHFGRKTFPAPLDAARARKFARRARTYRLLFKHFPTIEDGEAARQAWNTDGKKLFIESNGAKFVIGPSKQSKSFYAMIDRMYTVLKTHGNLIDMDFKFCIND